MPLMAVSGLAHPQRGWLAAVFYPFGHPMPCAYGFTFEMGFPLQSKESVSPKKIDLFFFSLLKDQIYDSVSDLEIYMAIEPTSLEMDINRLNQKKLLL
jgi:hypothetical protein